MMTTITTTIRQIPDNERDKFFMMLNAMQKLAEKEGAKCSMFNLWDLQVENRCQTQWIDDVFGWLTTTIVEILPQ